MYYCSALPLCAFYPHVKTVLCSCKICLGDQMSSSGLLCSGRLHSEVILLTFLPSSMFQEVFLSPFFPQMQKEVGQSHNIFLKSKNCQWVATKICNLQTDSSFELGWNNHSVEEVLGVVGKFIPQAFLLVIPVVPFISFHSSFTFCPYTWYIFYYIFQVHKSLNS